VANEKEVEIAQYIGSGVDMLANLLMTHLKDQCLHIYVLQQHQERAKAIVQASHESEG